MAACPTPAQLERMLAGTLPDAGRAAVENHVDGCPACQAELERLTAGPDDSGVKPAFDPTAETFVARLMALSPNPETRTRVDRPTLAGGPGRVPVVPGYAIEGELGRGGMGVVYKARDVRLSRPVALKMLLDGALSDTTIALRFLVEAEAVAQLRHPHVVQVYEFGQAEGRPYLAMEFVSGGNLAHRLTGGPPFPPARSAEIVAKLADAVAAAHRRGIIHRDLKPANVLLGAPDPRAAGAAPPADPDAALVPKITDFGIAKIGTSELTVTGSILGTPSYMSPEQAAGRTREIGTPADVYGLGAILYELLAGRPPFLGETAVDTLQQVVHVDPVPPRTVAPNVPRDLDTICRKCLEKAPGKRYATADALADDLRAFLDGRTITARPASALERAARFARRNPVPTAAAALVVAAFLGAFAWVSAAWKEESSLRVRADKALEFAEEQRGIAERAEGEQKLARGQADEARSRSDREAARSAFDQAVALCEQGDVGRGLDLFARCVELAERGGAPDLARVARRNVRAWLRLAPQAVARYGAPGEGEGVGGAAFADGGRLVVTASGNNGTVQFWPFRAGREPIRSWERSHGISWFFATLAAVWNRDWDMIQSQFKNASVFAVTVDPRRPVVYTTHGDGRVRRWSSRTAERIKPDFLYNGLTTLLSGAVSPDGEWLAAGAEDGMVRVWRLGDGPPVSQDLRHAPAGSGPEAVYALAFAHGGRTLLTGGRRDGVVVWELGDKNGKPFWTRTPERRFEQTGGGAFRLAVHPNGDLVMVGGDRVASLWRLGDPRRPARTWDHPTRIGAVGFSPDGRVCAAADHTGNVRCWDADTLTPVAAFRHPDMVTTIGFGPDGRHLLIGGGDGRPVAWRLPDTPWLDEVPGWVSSGEVYAVGFTPDDGGLWSFKASGSQLWRPGPNGYREPKVDPMVGKVRGNSRVPSGAVNADLTAAATAEHGLASFRVWGIPAGGPHRPEVQHPWPAVIGFGPDGRTLFTLERAAGAADRMLRWWKADARGVTADPRPWPTLPDTTCVALRPPAGELVLVGQRAGIPTRFRAAADGSPVGPELAHASTVTAAAFDPTGTLAATGCQDGSIRVWAGPEWAAQAGPFLQLGKVNQLAFGRGPSEGVLAAASDDHTVGFWDARTGLPLGPRLRHTDSVLSVAFDRAGNRLVTGSWTGPVKLWAVPPPPAAGTPDELRRAIRDGLGASVLEADPANGAE